MSNVMNNFSFSLGGKQGSENPADLTVLTCWSISAFLVDVLAPCCLARKIPHCLYKRVESSREVACSVLVSYSILNN